MNDPKTSENDWRAYLLRRPDSSNGEPARNVLNRAELQLPGEIDRQQKFGRGEGGITAASV